MRAKRLGCLTPPGLLAGLITLLVIAAAGVTSGGGMFSPGALNAAAGPVLGGVQSHAELSERCAACHTAPWSPVSMSARCLDCHTEIQAELSDPEALHAQMATDPVNFNCRECHTEHLGPQGLLTNMDVNDFAHDRVDYSLLGHLRHRDGSPFTCGDCHTESLARFDQAICAECHAELDRVYHDNHLADFGKDCLACHDGIDTYGTVFDHAQTGFPLTGKHAPLSCQDCHAGSLTPATLQATPQECAACHREDDPHAGEFGAECEACHTADDWGDVTFDHTQTDFPLDGAHVDVACQDCHLDNRYQGTPNACNACHADPEYHAGLFNAGCDSCHTTADWAPARFDDPHIFPFDHGEENNACRDCHPATLAEWTCYTCHDEREVIEEHQDEGIADFRDCLECHPTGEEDEGGRD